jgi:transcription initiation factor TFIIIB Brf1 subunit/transcription initiation factor TFIIB
MDPELFEKMKASFKESIEESKEEKEETTGSKGECECEAERTDNNYVCKKCGRVMREIVDEGSEWRYYGSNDTRFSVDPSRCGMASNFLLPNMNNAIKIAGFGTEKYRNVIKWSNSSYAEVNLIKIYNEIDQICNKLNIPDAIVQKSKLLCKLIISKNFKRGDIRKGIVGATVYYSCINKEFPIELDKIAKVIGITTGKMTAGCNYFREIINIVEPKYKSNLEAQTIDNIILNYTNKLNMNEKFYNRCMKVYKTADELGIINDNSRESTALGIIYFISSKTKTNLNKKHISKICGVSEVSVSKIYKNLNKEKYRKFLISVL